MKIDIILAGVGGQGILSIASIIGDAALKKGLFLKQAEVHGMSQRGGDVQSHLRISDHEIASDLIPEGRADLIIAVEPMESLRYLSFLSKDGWLITNNQTFINIPNYPSEIELKSEFDKLPHKVVINADKIAKDLGSQRSSNMVILGATSPYLNISYLDLEESVKDIFGPKGQEIVDINLKCMKAGKDFSEKINC